MLDTWLCFSECTSQCAPFLLPGEGYSGTPFWETQHKDRLSVAFVPLVLRDLFHGRLVTSAYVSPTGFFYAFALESGRVKTFSLRLAQHYVCAVPDAAASERPGVFAAVQSLFCLLSVSFCKGFLRRITGHFGVAALSRRWQRQLG